MVSYFKLMLKIKIDNNFLLKNNSLGLLKIENVSYFHLKQ